MGKSMKLMQFAFLLILFATYPKTINTKPFSSKFLLSSLSSFGDILSAGRDITQGTVSKLPDLIPTPESLLQLSKNVLAGYPFKVLATAINQLCSLALSSSSVKPKYIPDVNDMTFLLMTPSRNYSFPLVKPEEMWASSAFNSNKETVILVTGWTTDLNETNGAIWTLSNSYYCRGNVNFVVVDTARYVDTLYTWSAFNTEEIGNYIGQALILFSKVANISSIHLIGHSLGAHIVGAAGRSFTAYSNDQLPRITGLDPANPCFNEGEKLTGLQRGDAMFIDVIHSNPGVLGKADDIGDVDFYPGGMNPLPNGCISLTCAHSRAWEYYAETVLPGNEYNFLAVKCSSLSSLRSGKCIGQEIPMGYVVPKDARGNYFLEVNSDKPFGINSTQGNNVVCNNN